MPQPKNEGEMNKHFTQEGIHVANIAMMINF